MTSPHVLGRPAWTPASWRRATTCSVCSAVAPAPATIRSSGRTVRGHGAACSCAYFPLFLWPPLDTLSSAWMRTPTQSSASTRADLGQRPRARRGAEQAAPSSRSSRRTRSRAGRVRRSRAGEVDSPGSRASQPRPAHRRRACVTLRRDLRPHEARGRRARQTLTPPISVPTLETPMTLNLRSWAWTWRHERGGSVA